MGRTAVKDFTQYIGGKFGRLKIEEIIKVSNSRTKARCICECGNEIVATIDNIQRGHTKSCGCYQKELITKVGKSRKKHGYVGNKLYYIHQSMIARCENENHHAYKDYGGRGIEVCPEWHDMKIFANWALNSGYKEGLTLDRKDNDGDYCPENCKWSTWREQGNNRRTTLLFSYGGRTVKVSEIMEMTGISKGTFYSRLRNGWSIEKIIETPINKNLSRKKKSAAEQALTEMEGKK